MFTEADWTRVILYDSAAFPQFARRSMAQIAGELGTDGLGAMLWLIGTAPEAVRSHYVLRPMYDEADLFTAFGHDRCMAGSDATTLSTTGPLAGRFFHGAYSWAAWYISRVALGSGTLPLEEAIHRITARPCAKLGIPRRGALVPGHYADLVVFDPDRLADRTSMYEPNRPASGVRHLLVNGAITLRDETITRERGGRALQRERTFQN
jgi:N-acyl-D-amino-acid deacylase